MLFFFNGDIEMAVYLSHWPNLIFSEIHLNPEQVCILRWIITTTLNTTIACKFLAVSWRQCSLSPGMQDILAWSCAWFPGATISPRDTAGSQVITCLLGAGGGCELGSCFIHCCLAFPFFSAFIREGECLFSLCYHSLGTDFGIV